METQTWPIVNEHNHIQANIKTYPHVMKNIQPVSYDQKKNIPSNQIKFYG
jgi:hypothetical protein